MSETQVGKRFSNSRHGNSITERLAKLDRQRILRLRNRIKKRSLERAQIVYPTSHTSPDLIFPKSSLKKANSPSPLSLRPPSNGLERTQGVHYIFPFSPQIKRHNRQIDINDHVQALPDGKPKFENEIENSEEKDGSGGDPEDDYEGWDYEVSVDKTVAEEFSVSKSIADMIDYITSTFAPPLTLQTKTTTEQAVTTETTSPVSESSQDDETSEPSFSEKNELTENDTQSVQEKPSAQSNSIAKRIHPFLANRKLQVKNLNNAENSNDSIKLPTTRHPFFKPKATRKSLVNIDQMFFVLGHII